jgi:hypothetical protein
MNVEVAQSFFMWCAIINYSILILWCILFVFAHAWMERLNDAVLRRKIEHFDTIQYSGIALYKIGIILFNIVPWIALTLVH